MRPPRDGQCGDGRSGRLRVPAALRGTGRSGALRAARGGGGGVPAAASNPPHPLPSPRTPRRAEVTSLEPDHLSAPITVKLIAPGQRGSRRLLGSTGSS